MVVLVDTQGEQIDDIEKIIAIAGSYVSGGTNSLYYAEQMKKKNKSWLLWVFAVALIIFLCTCILMKSTEMGSKKSGSLFRYADYTDKILMFLGALGSIGEGMMTILILLVLSGLINQYATANLGITNDLVDKYSIRLLYVAIVVGTSAFFGNR